MALVMNQQKWIGWTGTLLFGLVVLLLLARDYVHSPLGTQAKTGALALMALGVGLLFLWAKGLYQG